MINLQKTYKKCMMGFRSGFRFRSNWVQVGIRFGCWGSGRGSGLLRVGFRSGSGLVVGVQVGVQVRFRLGSGRVQVLLLGLKSGSKFGSI